MYFDTKNLFNILLMRINIFKYHIIRHITIFCITGILSITLLKAQDVQFSQYMNAIHYLNPAMGSISPYTTFHANHRTQFTGLHEPYTSYYFSANTPVTVKGIRDSHIGSIGMNAVQDEAGATGFSTTIANINLSYRVPLSGDELHNLYFGLSGGFWQQRFQQGNIITGSQYQGTNDAGGSYQLPDGYNDQYLSPEINGGISWSFNPEKNDLESDFNIEAGLSFRQINRVDHAFGNTSRVSRMYNAHAGVTFHATPRTHFTVRGLNSYIQGSHHVIAGAEMHSFIIDEHTTFVPNYVSGGCYYRFNDAIVPVLAVGNDYYRIGFSYDAFRSYQELAGIANHTYEIALTFILYKKEGEKVVNQPRYIRDVL